MVSKYGVQDFKLFPKDQIIVSKAFHLEAVDENKKSASLSDISLKIPEGYAAKKANVVLSDLHFGESNEYSRFLIGNRFIQVERGGIGNKKNIETLTLNNETDIVPISIQSYDASCIANVEITCRPTGDAIRQWRVGIYNGLMEAYEEKMRLYKEQMEQLNTQQELVKFQGNNPGRNREIEKEELKRACLELFTAQKFDAFEAMNRKSAQGYPEFQQDRAIEEGKFIKFFEQAFEWDQMTYLFYSYFWGRKVNWTAKRQMKDTDPQFTQFLQAGAARVVLPVRPQFTDAILHFLATGGEIWNGGDVPTIDDPLYLSIVEEMKEAPGTAVGEPWIIKEPTSLVMLQGANPPELPDFSDELLEE